MKTFVIAEAGSNHNRDFKQALKLIDVAADSGADACKFQTYSSETLYSINTPDFAGHKNIPDLIKGLELPREWQKDLKEYCDLKGIEFMSTPFDEKGVEQLVDLGVKRLKIAGFESTDFRFVEMVASTGLPLIISLGIGFEEKYLESLEDIFSKYRNEVSFLHCNNAYPTPDHDINLKTISHLIKKTNHKVGLSDHTESTLTPCLAVAMGAVIIEKHYTLSKHLHGPDHPFALEPYELKEMIKNVRIAEKMLGDIKEKNSASELKFIKARRSIVAKRDIRKGEKLTLENITTKRPFLEGNISASEWSETLNQTASKNYKPDDFI
jgi:sialic acid synthase SpsE|tara:strand:+ start:4446 stop:5417 length:972 start_codon:yes stop_codon:yes gene_type:complete